LIVSPWEFVIGDAVQVIRDGKAIGGYVVAADAERFAVQIDGGNVEVFLQDTPAVQRLKPSRRRK
jgi:hypothetical protein